MTSVGSLGVSIRDWDCFHAANLAEVSAKWLPLLSSVFAIECLGIFMITKDLDNWITSKSSKT